jgi:DNA-binding NarL/FixJ family response regulator
VVALHDDQPCVFVFGVVTSGPATALTKQTALQMVTEAIQADIDGEGDRHRHRIMAKMPTRQREGAPAAIPDLTAREVQVLQ